MNFKMLGYYVFLIFTLVSFASCSNGTPGNARDITAFSIGDIVGVISGTEITVAVPDGTNVAALTPTIAVSGGASVSPASGVTQDFTGPVTYTVTAADGTTKAYTVMVIIPSAKNITAFSILGSTGIITGTNIAVTVPFGTDETDLTPTVTVSAGASVSPASGVAQDFTGPVTYTVTAADGSTKVYTVTVTVAASSAKKILTFSFPEGAGVITGTDIAVTVPYGTDVTGLIATFTTTGNSVTVGGTPQVSGVTDNDFTSPVHYIVTAADATTRDYTVTVTVAAASNIATVTSATYTVSAGGTANETITGVPTGTTMADFLAALTMGEVNQTWDDAGLSDPIIDGDTLIVTSQDSSTTVTYTVTVYSDIATVTSGTYTVSAGGTANETITGVPTGTTMAAFLLALTKGEANQTWDDIGIEATVVSGNTLVVTSHDGTKHVHYTVTVNP
jgi:hypothetical protein